MTPNFALLEAAISCGSPTRGSEYAYDTLLPGLKTIFPEAVCFPMEKLSPCQTYPPHLKHLDTVMAVNRLLRKNTLSALSDHLFPIIIGGDHSIAMGSLAALGEFYGPENIALVYIDAHTDINTEKTSDSHCIHGMDLASACGICCQELQVGSQKINILGQNIHIIGARSIDPPEHEIMHQLKVNCCHAQTLHRLGPEAICTELLPKLAGKYVHISFDVDFLDPSVFTSTGYNIESGGTWQDVFSLLKPLLLSGLVGSFECVEYNPNLDRQGHDKTALLEFFHFLHDTLSLSPL